MRRNEDKGKRKEMKATLGWGLSSYTGKMQGVVFCHYKHEGLIFVRKFTYPKITEHNHKIGSTTANLHSIQPSEGYKNDMRSYLDRYNKLRENENRYVRSWVNLYLKLMRDMAKQDNTIDLQTLTREEIYTRDLPCLSVKRSVEAGLLPVVYDYEALDRQI